MTLTQMQYIVAIDTYRHFAKAAAQCYVSQPTLSMQVQKLEEELGVALFDRSKQPVEPTDTGKKVLLQARLVLEETQRISEIVQDSQSELSGELRLALLPTVASTLLPRFLKPFREQYPLIRLHVEELRTKQILQRLEKGLLDAAIVTTPLEQKGVIEKPLYYEPFLAYVPAGHRLEMEEFLLPSDLDIHDILLLNEGHCFRENILNLCQFRQKKQQGPEITSIESGNFDTLIKLAQQGFGMTLLPYLTALDVQKQGDKAHIKPFDHPQPTREISIVYTRAKLKQGMINALSEIILQSLPEKLLEPRKQVVVSPQKQSKALI